MCQGFVEILFLHGSMLVASFLFNFLLIFTFSFAFAVNLFMGESLLSLKCACQKKGAGEKGIKCKL